MIAELAIANAAFGVIKETIANGGDIMAAGSHIFKFFDSKAELSKKAHQSGSDSEAFFALEAIKQNEQELQELMQWCGRPGLWDDWLQFQVEARRKRDEIVAAEVRKRLKSRETIANVVNTVLVVILVSTGLFAVIGLLWAIYTKGQF
jgi:hypothetical protein